jgi:putative transposase
VLALLHSDRFIDQAPAPVVTTLLEEGRYVCSERTMYRILAAAGQLKPRRQAARGPKHARPELMATAPNQVWTWDVTWLRGPVPEVFYYLYVILDIFSRYVVGWILAEQESGEIATALVEATYVKEGVSPGQVTLHADRGSVPRGHDVRALCDMLGIDRSFSRPRISDDNPYSEAHFKTFKYMPDYPDRFTSYEEALDYCRRFFPWYNHEHYHSGIAMLTPSDVHHDQIEEIVAIRQRTLDTAYAAHPERFARHPIAKRPPTTVYINPPLEVNSPDISL